MTRPRSRARGGTSSRAGGRSVYLGDLFGALPGGLRGRADILICNAPYVPTGDVAFLPAEARDHEPLVALDGGLDGLAILRRAAADAPGWLAPGGVLLVETSDRQGPEMAAAMAAAGLSPAVHDRRRLGCHRRHRPGSRPLTSARLGSGTGLAGPGAGARVVNEAKHGTVRDNGFRPCFLAADFLEHP